MFMSAVAAGLLMFASAGGAGGGDTPVVPLERSTVEAFIATPDAASLCTDIGAISDQVDQLSVLMGSDASFVFTMAVSYWQDMAEAGIGPSAAMTVEGQALFRDWVYDCAGRANPDSTEVAGFAGGHRPHPATVSSCYIVINRTRNPDVATGTCSGGYGWVQLEGKCYYFDGGPYTIGQSSWYYKYPGQTLTISRYCPSAQPYMQSAWFDFTK